MGVTFSDESTLKDKSIDRSVLRLKSSAVESLVNAYTNHYFAPVVVKSELISLLNTGLRGHLADINTLSSTLWSIFEQDDICSSQEVLMCIVLLCDTEWSVRLGYIFDIFKTVGVNEIGKEDVGLCVEVTLEALKRLWGISEKHMSPIDLANGREEIQALADSISTALFVKFSRDIDDGIYRDEFIKWGTERFKSSKTIASVDALMRLYSAQ